MLNNPHVSDSELRDLAKGNARLEQLYTEKDDTYFEERTQEEWDVLIEQAKMAMEEIFRS